jgi:hypothetical protein
MASLVFAPLIGKEMTVVPAAFAVSFPERIYPEPFVRLHRSARRLHGHLAKNSWTFVLAEQLL